MLQAIHPDPTPRWKLWLKRRLWPGTNWVSRDKARVVKMLLTAPPGQAPIRTLDCGCGNAYFTYEAARRGSRCLGITIHDWERRHCEEMRDYLGADPASMEFHTSRLDALVADPAMAGAFDQVLLFDVIEHIRDDRACLEQLRTLTADHGLLYLTTPDRDWSANADHLRVTRAEDGWHVRNGYTFDRLEHLLDAAGFEPVDRLKIGTLGSTVVTRIQHRLFGRRIDPLTVLTLPLLKAIAVLLSPWRDPHTLFVLARRRPDAERAAGARP